MSVEDEDHLSSLVAGLYAAAAEPDLWPAALDRLSDRLGKAAFVFSMHRPSGMAFGMVHRLDPECEAILREHYASPATNPLFGKMPRLPVLKPVPRMSIMDDDAYGKSALYNDVFRSQGLRHVAMACLARENGIIIPCGVLQPLDVDFEEEHARLLGVILPHLRRAIELSVLVHDAKASRLRAVSVANVPQDALMVVDMEARILFANARAEKYLSEKRLLSARGGRLSIIPHSAQSDLLRLIRAAANPLCLNAGSLALPAAGPSARWAVLVQPAPYPSFNGCVPNFKEVLIRIVDLCNKSAPPARQLKDLYRLTQAEADLAGDLARGLTATEIADKRGVRMSTVRSQIRSVLEKTGQQRLLDLVSLLDRIT